jgi:YHS domain-containing protein
LLVTCKGCKKKIDRDAAYKIIINGKNNYYCNQLEYENIKNEKENRLKVIDLSFEIIGYTTNTSLMKELGEIAKVHTYTKMLRFMESNLNELNNIMTRNFTSEYGKIKYFATVIKNKIGDYKELIEKTEVNNFEFIRVMKYTPTKKKTFTDYINEY